MELRRIRPQAIPEALERAQRYRLLNEPAEAESICRDVLAIEPDHQDALRILLLALTDQFQRNLRVFAAEARHILAYLSSDYDRSYYAGVIEERSAKALIAAGYPGEAAYEKVRAAMALFERAMPLAGEETDEATLRWNACIRMIRRHKLAPPGDPSFDADSFDDEVPYRERGSH